MLNNYGTSLQKVQQRMEVVFKCFGDGNVKKVGDDFKVTFSDPRINVFTYGFSNDYEDILDKISSSLYATVYGELKDIVKPFENKINFSTPDNNFLIATMDGSETLLLVKLRKKINKAFSIKIESNGCVYENIAFYQLRNTITSILASSSVALSEDELSSKYSEQEIETFLKSVEDWLSPAELKEQFIEGVQEFKDYVISDSNPKELVTKWFADKCNLRDLNLVGEKIKFENEETTLEELIETYKSSEVAKNAIIRLINLNISLDNKNRQIAQHKDLSYQILESKREALNLKKLNDISRVFQITLSAAINTNQDVKMFKMHLVNLLTDTRKFDLCLGVVNKLNNFVVTENRNDSGDPYIEQERNSWLRR